MFNFDNPGSLLTIAIFGGAITIAEGRGRLLPTFFGAISVTALTMRVIGNLAFAYQGFDNYLRNSVWGVGITLGYFAVVFVIFSVAGRLSIYDRPAPEDRLLASLSLPVFKGRTSFNSQVEKVTKQRTAPGVPQASAEKRGYKRVQ